MRNVILLVAPRCGSRYTRNADEPTAMCLDILRACKVCRVWATHAGYGETCMSPLLNRLVVFEHEGYDFSQLALATAGFGLRLS